MASHCSPPGNMDKDSNENGKNLTPDQMFDELLLLLDFPYGRSILFTCIKVIVIGCRRRGWGFTAVKSIWSQIAREKRQFLACQKLRSSRSLNACQRKFFSFRSIFIFCDAKFMATLMLLKKSFIINLSIESTLPKNIFNLQRHFFCDAEAAPQCLERILSKFHVNK